MPILGASLLGALTFHACVQTSPTRLENPFKPITLGELISSYVDHVEHHLDQIPRCTGGLFGLGA